MFKYPQVTIVGLNINEIYNCLSLLENTREFLSWEKDKTQIQKGSFLLAL